MSEGRIICYWYGIDRERISSAACESLRERGAEHHNLEKFTFTLPDPPSGCINVAFLADTNRLLMSRRRFTPCRFLGKPAFDGKTIHLVIRSMYCEDESVLRRMIQQAVVWADRALAHSPNGTLPWGQWRSR